MIRLLGAEAPNTLDGKIVGNATAAETAAPVLKNCLRVISDLFMPFSRKRIREFQDKTICRSCFLHHLTESARGFNPEQINDPE